MSAAELDNAAVRLEELDLDIRLLRDKLREQIAEFGSTPPRAEKSKRLVGNLYQFTLSTSTKTEVRDAEVERIAELCPESLFFRLFRKVIKYKLCDGASMVLAGKLPDCAPRNLRQMFARAVVVKEDSPRLKVERISQEACV